MIFSKTKIIAILASTMLGGSVFAQMPSQSPPVSVSTITKLEGGDIRRYVGFIEPYASVELQPRVSGFLEKSNFREGAEVKAGDLLFEIEDTSYNASVMAAEAALAKTKAELKYANDNYQRKAALAAQKAASTADKDDAIRLLELAKALVDAAQAELITAENNLSYTKIYAPISGIIGKNSCTVGNYVTPASGHLNKIVQLDPIYVRINLSGRDILRLTAQDISSPDNKLDFKLNLSDNTEYHAPWKLEIIDNEIDKSTDTINAWISFKNPEKRLIPGGYVTVIMSEHMKEDTPAVPSSALLNDANSTYVFVLDEKNQAVRRDITVGYTSGDKMSVTSGLKLGEKVIVDGTHKINRPNMVVTPIEEK